MFVYVGAYTDRPLEHAEGISVYRFDPQTGALSLIQIAPGSPNPSFLASRADRATPLRGQRARYRWRPLIRPQPGHRRALRAQPPALARLVALLHQPRSDGPVRVGRQLRRWRGDRAADRGRWPPSAGDERCPAGGIERRGRAAGWTARAHDPGDAGRPVRARDRSRRRPDLRLPAQSESGLARAERVRTCLGRIRTGYRAAPFRFRPGWPHHLRDQ